MLSSHIEYHAAAHQRYEDQQAEIYDRLTSRADDLMKEGQSCYPYSAEMVQDFLGEQGSGAFEAGLAASIKAGKAQEFMDGEIYAFARKRAMNFAECELIKEDEKKRADKLHYAD